MSLTKQSVLPHGPLFNSDHKTEKECGGREGRMEGKRETFIIGNGLELQNGGGLIYLCLLNDTFLKHKVPKTWKWKVPRVARSSEVLRAGAERALESAIHFSLSNT